MNGLEKLKKKKKYKYVLLINGNHEGFGDIILNAKYSKILQENNKLISDEKIVSELHKLYDMQVEKLRKIMTNCTILNDEAIVIENIKFYGSSWCNHSKANYGLYLEAKFIKKKWDKIPKDVDYLITHCPPQGILDKPESHAGCAQLRLMLNSLTKLKVHQFGHVHGTIYDYDFVTKESMSNSLKDEKKRGVHKSGKHWFYLIDNSGKKLVKYKEDKMNKLDIIDKCVLFINAVNDGVKQANWLYFPAMP
eukprot:260880_1